MLWVNDNRTILKLVQWQLNNHMMLLLTMFANNDRFQLIQSILKTKILYNSWLTTESLVNVSGDCESR